MSKRTLSWDCCVKCGNSDISIYTSDETPKGAVGVDDIVKCPECKLTGHIEFNEDENIVYVSWDEFKD